MKSREAQRHGQYETPHGEHPQRETSKDEGNWGRLFGHRETMRHWTKAAWKAVKSVHKGISFRGRDGRQNWDVILWGFLSRV